MMTIRDFLYPVEDIRHYGVKLNELLELLTDNESPVKFENLLEPTDSENSPFKEAPQLVLKFASSIISIRAFLTKKTSLGMGGAGWNKGQSLIRYRHTLDSQIKTFS